MKLISVEVVDVTGAKRFKANIPNDVPIKRIISTLAAKMNLPKKTPDGEPLTYQLHHRNTGKTLSEDGTLAAAGVKDGAILKIHPVVVAGYFF
jgi:uncharacterized ubiquitin-like protein YukD